MMTISTLNNQPNMSNFVMKYLTLHFLYNQTVSVILRQWCYHFVTNQNYYDALFKLGVLLFCEQEAAPIL